MTVAKHYNLCVCWRVCVRFFRVCVCVYVHERVCVWGGGGFARVCVRVCACVYVCVCEKRQHDLFSVLSTSIFTQRLFAFS